MNSGAFTYNAYMASVSDDGNIECVEDELNEMIRKIVKRILNENKHGIWI